MVLRYAALLLTLPLGAQQPRLSVERVRADIAFLSSDALEGRKALQRGSDAAAEFIAAEFAKAGLKPGAGNSYLQRVELIEYRTDARARRLAFLRRGGAERVLEFGRDYSGGGLAADYAISGGVVFAGYGITAPEYGYDDYAGVDARGKLVLIFEHEPQENDARSVFHGLGSTRHAGPRMKALNAQQHGAVGVLMMAEPNRKHPSTPERLARIAGSREYRGAASQALAESEVRIPSFLLNDGAAGELLENKAELQARIDAELKPAGFELADTRVEARGALLEWRRAPTFNVVGLIEGSDLKGESVVLGSHYDHLGVRGDGTVYHGADDNASGTAGVIELARALAGARPRRTLVFASFGAEEAGLLGSYFYAAHPVGTTRAVLNLDMIGRDEKPSAQTEKLMAIAEDTSNEVNFVGSAYSPELRALIERENRGVGLRLNYKWEDDAALSILFRCDHYPFLARGIPAVWFFNGFQPDYHQVSDTLEKLNFPKMMKIVRLAGLAALTVANREAAPKFEGAR